MSLPTTFFRDCAVPQCRKRIAVQYQLCATCWRKLPIELRREVSDTMAGHRSGTRSTEDAVAVTRKAVEAVEAAKARTVEGGAA